MTEAGIWVDLVEYALKQNLSVSTVRRYIKANKVVSKLIEGKYFVWSAGVQAQVTTAPVTQPGFARIQTEVLQKKINELFEENQELKMLIKLYEEQSSQQFSENQSF